MATRYNLRNQMYTTDVQTAQNTPVPTTTTQQRDTRAQFQPVVDQNTGKWAPPPPERAPQLPAGFDIRVGSTDPAINRQVYGSNYFPGTLAGFEQVTNPDAFYQLTPEQQGAYRQALYMANRGLQTPTQGNPTNYMGYLPPGLQMKPNYLPEIWDYKQSPEYQQRLAWAQRDLNRQLLAMGRSDSTGGINAMARQQAEIAGQEIDKQYQRALNANMQNYNRAYQAQQTAISEDERAYARAMGIDERDYARWKYGNETEWNRNLQLEQIGQGATQSGVNAGNVTAQSLASLFRDNGATQAQLALERGDVDANRIYALLQAGLSFAQINGLIPWLTARTTSPGTTSTPPVTNSASRANYYDTYQAGGGTGNRETFLT